LDDETIEGMQNVRPMIPPSVLARAAEHYSFDPLRPRNGTSYNDEYFSKIFPDRRPRGQGQQEAEDAASLPQRLLAANLNDQGFPLNLDAQQWIQRFLRREAPRGRFLGADDPDLLQYRDERYPVDEKTVDPHPYEDGRYESWLEPEASMMMPGNHSSNLDFDYGDDDDADGGDGDDVLDSTSSGDSEECGDIVTRDEEPEGSGEDHDHNHDDHEEEPPNQGLWAALANRLGWTSG
jgi:hypothetical protein